jgi:O-antigen ligase
MVDSTLDGRIWANTNALEIFQKHPIIGSGPGSYGGQTAIYNNSPIYLEGMQNGYVALPYTDNQWLQILVQTGIFGIAFIIMFFISYIANNLIQFKKNSSMLSVGMIAIVASVVINGFFANIWEFSAIATLSGSYLGLGNSYESR